MKLYNLKGEVFKSVQITSENKTEDIAAVIQSRGLVYTDHHIKLYNPSDWYREQWLATMYYRVRSSMHKLTQISLLCFI